MIRATHTPTHNNSACGKRLRSTLARKRHHAEQAHGTPPLPCPPRTLPTRLVVVPPSHPPPHFAFDVTAEKSKFQNTLGTIFLSQGQRHGRGRAHDARLAQHRDHFPCQPRGRPSTVRLRHHTATLRVRCSFLSSFFARRLLPAAPHTRAHPCVFPFVRVRRPTERSPCASHSTTTASTHWNRNRTVPSHRDTLFV